MPLTKVNHHNQHSYPSRMSLAKLNHHIQLDHPSRMSIVEANNHHNQPDIHLECH
jgi:hypothetical protein